MDTSQDLKDQARSLEHSGQDQAALDLYLRLAGEAPSDASVLVRIGNLQIRLGRPEEAVSSYARSAELLEEAGLTNSALALFHRIVRVQPDFVPALLHLGELSARAGYAQDAHTWLRRYVESTEAAGDPEPGWEALRSHLRSHPGDREMRQLLIDRLEGHGRDGEADAERQALESAPGHAARREPSLPEAWAPESGDPADAEPVEELEVLGSEWEGAALPGAARVEPDADIDLVPTSLEAEGAEDEVAPLAGLEPTRVEGLASTSLESEWPEPEAPEEDAEPLALLGGSPDPVWEDAPENDAEADAGLPLLGAGAFEESGPEAEAEAPAESPAEGGLPELATAAVDPLQRLGDRVLQDPADLDARHELIALLQEGGDIEALIDALEDAHPAFAAAGRWEEAGDLLSGLIEHRPDDEALLARRAEYALNAGDDARSVAALLALARRIDPQRDPERAREAFERVLELDPDNQEARESLAALLPAEAPSAVPDGYVDFGALILDDEPEDSTRAQVAVEHPSGDEDRDFAEILSLFRQQVSERIDPGDAASHYDLGLAFKEMGLLDDAITQLQVALRGGANPVATLEVLGECFVEKGEHSLAARVFQRATQITGADEGSLVGVRYWLGRCQEALGEPEAARTEYERVVAVDFGFRDAAARLDSLRAR